MPKTTGLAAFARAEAKPLDADLPASQPRAAQATRARHGDAPPAPRARAQGPTVALTVRLTRTQWERLHHLAVAEGTSLQALALRGLATVLGERGLKL